MYGAFNAWMIEGLGGLQVTSNTTTTAWEHFVVRPNPQAILRLNHGGYSIQTRFGLTSLDWLFVESTKHLVINLTVPVGSKATLNISKELKTGIVLKNVTMHHKMGLYLTPFTVGSGTYSFVAHYGSY